MPDLREPDGDVDYGGVDAAVEKLMERGEEFERSRATRTLDCRDPAVRYVVNFGDPA